MFDQTNPQLTQVYEYLKAGKRDQARALLEPIVSAEPDNIDAWWLMAMAVTTPDAMRNALQNVVRINPNYLNARQLLDAMAGPSEPPAPSASSIPSGPSVPTMPSVPPPAPSAGTQIGESADDLFHAFEAPAPLPPASPYSDLPRPSTGPSSGRVPPYPAPVAAQPRRTNPLVFVLLGMVGILICICGACVLLFGGSFFALMRDPTVQAVVSTGITRVEAPDRLPSDARPQGTITSGRSQTDRLGPLEQHTWKYQGHSGERITVTVSAQTATLNVFVGLYDSSGMLLSRSDIARTNRDQTLAETLPDDGTYSILIGGLGGSFGSYQIQVTSSSSSQ